MRAGETTFQMCIRHVAEQETRIAQQEALIERLRESRSTLLDDHSVCWPKCTTFWGRCANTQRAS